MGCVEDFLWGIVGVMLLVFLMSFVFWGIVHFYSFFEHGMRCREDVVKGCGFLFFYIDFFSGFVVVGWIKGSNKYFIKGAVPDVMVF